MELKSMDKNNKILWIRTKFFCHGSTSGSMLTAVKISWSHGKNLNTAEARGDKPLFKKLPDYFLHVFISKSRLSSW